MTGATGLVGSEVLRALLGAQDVCRVTSLGRRPSGEVHPKLTDVPVHDFGNSSELMPHLAGVDTVLRCLATYTAKVSRDQYTQITVDWLEALLRATERKAPEAHFGLFSASGARPEGGGISFALRTKGTAENRLFDAALPRVCAFRPRAIAPTVARAVPTFADRIAKGLVTLLPFTGISSRDLARAILVLMRQQGQSIAVFENSDLRSALG
ncbi:MAG: hypothetical protein MK160_07435 [Rhodobacteraceae bacterium]|nr:hypothetical protein [Paracoccaceae bacterium]